jgi:hypothetical protein
MAGERSIAFQFPFQNNRLVLFEDQGRTQFLITPFSVLNGSRSGVSSLDGTGDLIPICL